MSKISELTTKVTPIGADLVTGLDSADSNPQTKNKNYTLDSIGSLALSSGDTDDLAEGATNKYSSTANVDAAGATMNTDTTLVGNSYFLDEDDLVSDDATKVPSQQSVKAYVDNKGTDINGLVEEAGITDGDELIYYNGVSNVKVDYTDLKSSIITGSNLNQVASVGTLTFDDVAQTDITINHTLGVVPTKLDFIFPDSTDRRGHWADDDGTKTSIAAFNNGSFSRYITTNEAIATYNDANNSNGEWRINSISTTQVVLTYTIVNDGGSWSPTTETNVYVSISA